MVLIVISVLGSYSRGGFLALTAMGAFLWIKSRKKIVLGIMLAALVVTVLAFMPEAWYAKIGTIETYQQDTSAMGRIGAWRFATNLALHRPIGGGGFETFQKEAYEQYAPGEVPLDPHSIWFQMLGEQGFVGLGLFVLFWILAWRTGSQIIRLCRDRPDFIWARDLAGMIQAGLVGFMVGGSFLGLAYWDYPYILVIVLVLTKVVVERQLQQRVEPAPRPVPAPSRLRTQG
jgi:probable O-glycosylation ligase (exosortase A-associated)